MKNHYYRRLLSFILISCLCFTMMPTVIFKVSAADPTNLMVSYAQARVGKTGQQLGYTTEWCAYFVSDCASYAGQTKAIPRHGNAHSLYFLVKEAGGYEVTSPKAGDLVFYNCTACDSNGDGISMMHVGLVEDENHTIEGNLDGSSFSTRSVKRKGISDRYSHGSGHSTDNYVKRVFVRPAYEGVTIVAPNKPTITSKSYYYAEGSTATISWSAVEGNSYYWISIWKDGDLIVNQTMDNETSYTMSNLAKGEYKFAVSANNSAGNSGGTSFSFLVGKAPDKTEVSIDQASYTVGDTITASWTDETGTTYYWINVYKDGELIVNKTMDLKTSYTIENAEIGEYKIAVSANNGAGNSGGSSVSFSVSPIGAPVISSSKTNYKTSQTVEVSWDAVAGASEYIYYLSEYPNEYAYTTNVSSARVTTTKASFDNLPNGRYSIFVCSISEAGKWSSQSNWITFYVYNTDYVPVKTIESNGHIYALFDEEMSWDFAKIICNEMGGHLATVTSEQENALITELIDYGDRDAYWLGANNVVSGSYKTTGEPFEWITGETFGYSNWKTGEPSQSGEKASLEHFLEIRKSYDNQWNDTANTNRTNKGFILEIDTTVYNPTAVTSYGDSKYLLLDESLPWAVAQAYCESIGGHLASIISEEEDEAVHALLEQGQKAWYYIGASKTNGEWTWIDNRSTLSIGYSNWSSSSSWGNYLMKYKVSGDWIGIHNFYSPGSNMEHMGFVCEIDNAVFTVSYDANGGNSAPEEQRKVLNEDLVLSSTFPVREGYAFLGWSMSSDATNVDYEAGAVFSLDSDITLYAVWEKETVLLGDVNGDGSVDTLDRSMLSRYLANWDGYTLDQINAAGADLNCDGSIDTLDRSILSRYLANWAEYDGLLQST